MVEIVGQPSDGAEVRLFTLSGHWRTQWELQGERRFHLPAAEYRQLSEQVDTALAAYRGPNYDHAQGEVIICTDGPGFLTERVREGRVVTLTGQCPPTRNELHSNRLIAASIDAMLCRSLGLELRWSPFNWSRCRRR